MKIGLVRHFKVDYQVERIMDSEGFEKYVSDYDISPVIKNEVYLGEKKWDKCYCSDLERACITADSIYDGEIIKNNLLREVQMYPTIKSKFKIPAFLWSISARLAWKLNNKSQLEGKKDTVKRAQEFLNNIDLDSNEDILIVSHGFFLMTLVNELKLLGFKGSIPKRMDNGTLYILEK